MSKQALEALQQKSRSLGKSLVPRKAYKYAPKLQSSEVAIEKPIQVRSNSVKPVDKKPTQLQQRKQSV